MISIAASFPQEQINSKKVHPELISFPKSAFIQGRDYDDKILVAHQISNYFSKNIKKWINHY